MSSMSSDVGPPFRQSSLTGSARRSSTVSMLRKLVRLSAVAVAVPENKNAFKTMILMSFFDFMSKSFLVLSKNRSSFRRRKLVGFEPKSDWKTRFYIDL